MSKMVPCPSQTAGRAIPHGCLIDGNVLSGCTAATVCGWRLPTAVEVGSGGIEVKSNQCQEWVALLQAAERKRSAAVRTMTLVIVGIVAVSMCLMWSAIIGFRNRLPEFSVALSREAALLAPGVACSTQRLKRCAR